jgi:hypothetical protein
MAADAGPVRATEKLDRADGPVQSVAVFPVAGFNVATPVSPSTYSANRISPADRQKRWDGEALRSGVRFFGSPPDAGTSQMSPPVAPSSLMMP